MHRMVDSTYTMPQATTYALELRKLFSTTVPVAGVADPQASLLQEPPAIYAPAEDSVLEESIDVLRQMDSRAIAALREDVKLMERIRSETGVAWGSLRAFFLEQLPEQVDDRGTVAYHLVRKAMDEIFGPQNQAWESYKNPQRGTVYVRLKAGAR
jgi:hypothetical protein